MVRLWPEEEVTHGLCVAEGIETALSAALGFGLAWAMVTARNLENLPVLEGVEALTSVADHDKRNPRTGERAGSKAARTCARRWAAEGREVRLWQAASEETGLNDFMRGAA